MLRNPGPGSDQRVLVLNTSILGLHANLDELDVAGSDCNVLVCAESKVPDRHLLLELCIPGFGCPQQRLRNPTSGAQGMALDVREGFIASWSVLVMNPVCFVFTVGRTIFMCMPFTITQGTMVHFMIVSLTLWLGYSQLMIKQSLSLSVMQMLITLT